MSLDSVIARHTVPCLEFKGSLVWTITGLITTRLEILPCWRHIHFHTPPSPSGIINTRLIILQMEQRLTIYPTNVKSSLPLSKIFLYHDNLLTFKKRAPQRRHQAGNSNLFLTLLVTAGHPHRGTQSPTSLPQQSLNQAVNSCRCYGFN